jgi:hypothetical protein
LLERTDKIGLIVASVLVVLLAAGAGGLLYQRSNNGPGTVAAAESSVTLSPLDDKSTLPSVPKPKPAPAPAKLPRVWKGAKFGYVTKVGKSGLSLRWDLAELLTGKEADLYAKKQGKVMADAPYCIANETDDTDVYDVSNKAVIKIIESGLKKTITPAELKKRYDAKPGVIQHATWIMVEQDNVVTSLEQVVLPPKQS